MKFPSRFVPSFISKGKNLSIEMLRAGWVTTYEQAGASYGTEGKDEFLRIEAEAKYVPPLPNILTEWNVECKY